MSSTSPIEWTDATWNPTTGCTKISPGCAHCYIERTPPFRMAGNRFVDGKTDLLIFHDRLDQPLHWRKPRRVFVNSLSDLFHEDIADAFIDRVFAVMALAPQHTFQVLTKRADRMRSYVSGLGAIDWKARLGDTRSLSLAARTGSYPTWPLPNVWLGVSVENQHFADERIPLLLQTPAAVRFISAEPLLGPVDLDKFVWPACIATREQHDADHGGGMWCDERCLDWVIVGGESGHGARSFDLAWARSIVSQCRAAGVPVFVKQLGARPLFHDGGGRTSEGLRHPKGGDPTEWPEDLRVREFPACCEPARTLAARGRR